MIFIGKSKAKMKALRRLLATAHIQEIQILLMDLDHKHKNDISPFFMDGAVTVDSTADITRALDLNLFDPMGEINLDPDSPGRTSIFIADMIQVIFIIEDPWHTERFEIPVFTGPIDDVDRDDILISVKALGKENLSAANVWRARTFKEKQERTTVIRRILREMCGETKMRVPNLKRELSSPVKMNGDDIPWTKAKSLAKGLGYQLFYNGLGVAVMRKKKSKRPVFQFKEDIVTTFPKTAYDLQNTVNAVRVVGGKPKKARKKITYTAVAPRKHPLSPWRLGRGNAPRFLWLEIQDESIKSKKEARELAKKELEDGLLAGIEVTFDGIPVPFLEENDVCRVDLPGFHQKFKMKKFTIPLVAGDDASFGYLRRARPKGGQRGVKTKKKDRNKGKGKDKK